MISSEIPHSKVLHHRQVKLDVTLRTDLSYSNLDATSGLRVHANQNDASMPANLLENENLDLWTFLDREEVKAVLDRSEEPFEEDDEYLETVALYYRCLQLRIKAKKGLFSEYAVTEEHTIAVEQVKERLTRLEKIADSLHTSIQRRIRLSSGNSTRPRMLKLADRLSLSDTERKIFEYVVLCNTHSPLSEGHTLGDVELHDVALLLSLSPKQTLELTNPTLPLYTDGLLTVEEPGIIASGLRRDLEIKFEVLKAIWGVDLTRNEFFGRRGYGSR